MTGCRMQARDAKTWGQRSGRITRGTGCAVAAIVLLVLLGLFGFALYRSAGRWDRRVEAKLEEFRAAGQPVTWAEVLAARRQIPDDENSALILLEAFDQIQEPGGHVAWFLGDFRAGPSDGALHSEQTRTIVRTHLSANADALKLIHEAARFPLGAYPLPPVANPMLLPMDHLSGVRAAARLCTLQAVFYAEEGNGDGAVRSLTAGAAVSSSLGDCVTLIDVLVRMAVDSVWLDGIERALQCGEMPVGSVQTLRQLILREDGQLSLKLAFCGERSHGHYYFSGAPGDTTGLATMSRLQDMVPTWLERDSLFYYDTLGEAVRICELPLRERWVQAKEYGVQVDRELEEASRWHPMSSMTMPALAGAIEVEVTAHVRLRAARTALAVEEWRLKHGGWPDSLEELVPELLDAVPQDPFSDGAIRYEKTVGGVVVYSVGEDGKDHGGLSQDEVLEQREPQEDEPEDWDLPFRLLNPELRGARTRTFREEVMESGLGMEGIEVVGFTEEKLLELGFTQEDLEELKRLDMEAIEEAGFTREDRLELGFTQEELEGR